MHQRTSRTIRRKGHSRDELLPEAQSLYSPDEISLQNDRYTSSENVVAVSIVRGWFRSDLGDAERSSVRHESWDQRASPKIDHVLDARCKVSAGSGAHNDRVSDNYICPSWLKADVAEGLGDSTLLVDFVDGPDVGENHLLDDICRCVGRLAGNTVDGGSTRCGVRCGGRNGLVGRPVDDVRLVELLDSIDENLNGRCPQIEREGVLYTRYIVRTRLIEKT